MSSESISTTAAAPTSAWAPLRNSVFRALWLAVLGSQVGTWMQTVGAQWLLVDHPNAATLVSLVQTASMLPVLLLALPAGVLADTFDRRRLLIAVQLFQAAVGIVLTLLTMAGQMSPALLLVLTFALGCGAAMTVPTYQAVIPELVPRSQLASASALGAISMNLARAAGPAIAGVLVAQIGVAAVFALNAATFVAFAVVLFYWRRETDDGDRVAEPFVAALKAGGRYVRHSPIMRRMLLRTLLFIAPAVCMWALLPLVASDRLGLGAGGYGLLLAAVGLGAVVGAPLMPRLRARLSDNLLLGASSAVFGVVLLVLGLVRQPAVVTIALVPAGLAWMAVLSSVNANVQLFLPQWVRARGLSAYQIVFFGGQGIGALLWGVVADYLGLVPTFLIAAALTLIAGATVKLWPLHEVRHLNRESVSYWPEPRMDVEPDRSVGPVVVTVSYTVPPADAAAFLDAMERVRRSRMRTGAVQWGLFRPGEHPDQMVEIYVVPSWDEHLRQHEGRLTATDEETEARAKALSTTPPEVTHLLPAEIT
jgi:MFS family permease